MIKLLYRDRSVVQLSRIHTPALCLVLLLIAGLRTVTLNADRDLLGLSYQLWKNTVYLDCVRKKKKTKKKTPPKIYTDFLDAICGGNEQKSALQIKHKSVSVSLMHFTTIQKVWKTAFCKSLEMLWKVEDATDRTKPPYYLRNLRIYFDGHNIRQNTTGRFEYVLACASSAFSLHVPVALTENELHLQRSWIHIFHSHMFFFWQFSSAYNICWRNRPVVKFSFLSSTIEPAVLGLTESLSPLKRLK